MKKTILKTLVGSRAHGLHKPDSDYDYRGVYVIPTSELVSLGYKEKAVSWIEGEREDQTAYEVHHFLNLATHSNPSILEVMVSPIQEETEEGRKLRELFPYIWNSNDVKNAFCGYSHNQQKKMMDGKADRPYKYAVAYIRVLLLAEEILSKGTMTIQIEEGVTRQNLLKLKNEEFSLGFVIDWAEDLKKRVQRAFEANPNKQTDFEKVNEYLLWVRKENW
jgi:predicted nucleotidyltransferase